MNKKQPQPPPHLNPALPMDDANTDTYFTSSPSTSTQNQNFNPQYQSGYKDGYEKGCKQAYESGMKEGMLGRDEARNEATRESEWRLQYHIETKKKVEETFKREYTNLTEKIKAAEQKLARREQDYIKMESNYLEDKKALQATEDDFASLHDQFRRLKYGISQLLLSATPKCNRQAAYGFLSTKFKDMKIFSSSGNSIDGSTIALLMEKYIVEYIIREFLSNPLLAGLSIGTSYNELFSWLKERKPHWATRLRQQMTVTAVRDPESQQHLFDAAKRATDHLSAVFKHVYPSWIDPNNKLADIVNTARQLSIAIRSQDIEIQPMVISEGKQIYDPETMELDSNSRKQTGIVVYCIFPPFFGSDNHSRFLEKGRVYLG
ncbi:uncharacterized protein VTP21DRAFT_2036 [Calcarisporiella thermophila]|uniref:uncharacterized protein n=1 Tax=Calcarisporiella thermophila TaxID=911321 RepID=UPI003742F0F0